MEEKTKEFKKARTVRSDYITEVKDVQNWIRDAELQIQDRSVEPHLLNDHLQKIQSEVLNTADLVEKLTKNGRIIIDKTRDEDEKKLVQSSIDNLTDQLQKIRSLLDEKKQQVGGAQDAWKRFLNLYEAVMTWVKEKDVFLKEALIVSTLSETKQKLHDYGNAVKSCKIATKNLSDMAKELDHIGTVTTVGDLPQKMEQAEEAKLEVESQILARNSLLQETSEEWEQCEKKMKDVKSWIEKTRSALESPQNKKKPLRDQHALREKLVNDCQIQKTKISLSVDKLQLHFRSGIGGDSKIAESADDLSRELDELNITIKEQSRQLETAITQVDQYQLEVQQLRQKILQVEQQLRSVINPTQLPQDSEQMLRDQQTLLAQKEHLKTKINALLVDVRKIDPYYDAKGLTYAEIVAGHLLQQQLQQAEAEKSHGVEVETHIHEKIEASIVSAEAKPTPEISTPPVTVVTPEIDTSDFIKKEPRSKPNRRGRSPNKREDKPKSKIPKKIVETKPETMKPEVILKAPEDVADRKRARSPIWIPGSTTYAEILMGSSQPNAVPQQIESEKEESEILPLRKTETSQPTETTENVEFIEPLVDDVEQFDSQYVEEVSQEIPEVSDKPENVYVSIESQSWVEPQIEYQHTQTTYELPVTLPQIPTTTYYQTIPQQNLPPGMYGCIQPVPDLVGFIASGQQLMSSGLGTYHNSNQYNVYPNQTYQQYYEVPEHQQEEQSSYTYTPTTYPEEIEVRRVDRKHKHKETSTKVPQKEEPKPLAVEKPPIVLEKPLLESKPNGQFSYAQILSQGLSAEPLQPSSASSIIPTNRRSQSPRSLSPKHSDQFMPKDDRSKNQRNVTARKHEVDEALSMIKQDKRLTTKTKKRYGYIEIDPQETVQPSTSLVYHGELDSKSSGTEAAESVSDQKTFSDTDKPENKKKRKKAKPRKSSKDEIDKALKEIQEITEIKRKGHRKDSQSSQQDLTSDSTKPDMQSKQRSKKKSEEQNINTDTTIDEESERKENIEIVTEFSTIEDSGIAQKKKKHKKKKSKSKLPTNETDPTGLKRDISESSTQKASSEETLNAEQIKESKSKKSKNKKKPSKTETTPETVSSGKEDTEVLTTTTQKDSSEETLSPTEESENALKKSKSKRKPKRIEKEVEANVHPQKTSSEETFTADVAKIGQKKSKSKKKKRSQDKTDVTCAEEITIQTQVATQSTDSPLELDSRKESSEEVLSMLDSILESQKKSKKKKKAAEAKPSEPESTVGKPIKIDTQMLQNIERLSSTEREFNSKDGADIEHKVSKISITEEVKDIPLKSKKSRKKNKTKEKDGIEAGIREQPVDAVTEENTFIEIANERNEQAQDVAEIPTKLTELVILTQTEQGIEEAIIKDISPIITTEAEHVIEEDITKTPKSVIVIQTEKAIDEGSTTTAPLTLEIRDQTDVTPQHPQILIKEIIEVTQDVIAQSKVELPSNSEIDTFKPRKSKKEKKKYKALRLTEDIDNTEELLKIEHPISEDLEILVPAPSALEVNDVDQVIESNIPIERQTNIEQPTNSIETDITATEFLTTELDQKQKETAEKESITNIAGNISDDIKEDRAEDILPVTHIIDENVKLDSSDNIQKPDKQSKRKKGKSKGEKPTKVVFQTVTDPISFQTQAQETEITKIERPSDISQDKLDEQNVEPITENSQDENVMTKPQVESEDRLPNPIQPAKISKDSKKKKKDKKHPERIQNIEKQTPTSTLESTTATENILAGEAPLKESVIEEITEQIVTVHEKDLKLKVENLAEDIISTLTQEISDMKQSTLPISTVEKDQDISTPEVIEIIDKIIEKFPQKLIVMDTLTSTTNENVAIISGEDSESKVVVPSTTAESEELQPQQILSVVSETENTQDNFTVHVDNKQPASVDNTKTNKFILITHEAIKMQPVVSLKMEITARETEPITSETVDKIEIGSTEKVEIREEETEIKPIKETGTEESLEITTEIQTITTKHVGENELQSKLIKITDAKEPIAVDAGTDGEIETVTSETVQVLEQELELKPNEKVEILQQKLEPTPIEKVDTIIEEPLITAGEIDLKRESIRIENTEIPGQESEPKLHEDAGRKTEELISIDVDVCPKEEIHSVVDATQNVKSFDVIDQFDQNDIEIEHAIFGSVKDRSRGKNLKEVANESISTDSGKKKDKKHKKTPKISNISDIPDVIDENQGTDLSKPDSFANVSEQVLPEPLTRLDSIVDVEINDIREVMDVLAKKQHANIKNEPQVTSPTPSSASNEGTKKKRKRKNKNKTKKDEDNVHTEEPDLEQSLPPKDIKDITDADVIKKHETVVRDPKASQIQEEPSEIKEIEEKFEITKPEQKTSKKKRNKKKDKDVKCIEKTQVELQPTKCQLKEINIKREAQAEQSGKPEIKNIKEVPMGDHKLVTDVADIKITTNPSNVVVEQTVDDSTKGKKKHKKSKKKKLNSNLNLDDASTAIADSLPLTDVQNVAVVEEVAQIIHTEIVTIQGEEKNDLNIIEPKEKIHIEDALTSQIDIVDNKDIIKEEVIPTLTTDIVPQEETVTQKLVEQPSESKEIEVRQPQETALTFLEPQIHETDLSAKQQDVIQQPEHLEAIKDILDTTVEIFQPEQEEILKEHIGAIDIQSEDQNKQTLEEVLASRSEITDTDVREECVAESIDLDDQKGTFEPIMPKEEALTIDQGEKLDIKLEEQAHLVDSQQNVQISVLQFIREEIQQIENDGELKSSNVSEIEKVPEELQEEEIKSQVIKIDDNLREEIDVVETISKPEKSNIATLSDLAENALKYDMPKMIDTETKSLIYKDQEVTDTLTKDADLENVTQDKLKVKDLEILPRDDQKELRTVFDHLESEISRYDLPRMLEYETVWYMSQHPSKDVETPAELQIKPTVTEKGKEMVTPQIMEEVSQPQKGTAPQRSVENLDRKLLGMIDEIPTYDITQLIKSETEYFVEKKKENLKMEDMPIVEEAAAISIDEKSSEDKPFINDESLERIMAIISEGKQTVDEIVNEFVESTQSKELEVVNIPLENDEAKEVDIQKGDEPETLEKMQPESDLREFTTTNEKTHILEKLPPIDLIVPITSHAAKEEIQEPQSAEDMLKNQPEDSTLIDPTTVHYSVEVHKPIDLNITSAVQQKVASPGTPKHFMYDVLQYNISHNLDMTEMLQTEIDCFAKQSIENITIATDPGTTEAETEIKVIETTKPESQMIETEEIKVNTEVMEPEAEKSEILEHNVIKSQETNFLEPEVIESEPIQLDIELEVTASDVFKPEAGELEAIVDTKEVKPNPEVSEESALATGAMETKKLSESEAIIQHISHLEDKILLESIAKEDKQLILPSTVSIEEFLTEEIKSYDSSGIFKAPSTSYELRELEKGVNKSKDIQREIITSKVDLKTSIEGPPVIKYIRERSVPQQQEFVEKLDVMLEKDEVKNKSTPEAAEPLIELFLLEDIKHYDIVNRSKAEGADYEIKKEEDVEIPTSEATIENIQIQPQQSEEETTPDSDIIETVDQPKSNIQEVKITKDSSKTKSQLEECLAEEIRGYDTIGMQRAEDAYYILKESEQKPGKTQDIQLQQLELEVTSLDESTECIAEHVTSPEDTIKESKLVIKDVDTQLEEHKLECTTPIEFLQTEISNYDIVNMHKAESIYYEIKEFERLKKPEDLISKSETTKQVEVPQSIEYEEPSLESSIRDTIEKNSFEDAVDADYKEEIKQDQSTTKVVQEVIEEDKGTRVNIEIPTGNRSFTAQTKEEGSTIDVGELIIEETNIVDTENEPHEEHDQQFAEAKKGISQSTELEGEDKITKHSLVRSAENISSTLKFEDKEEMNTKTIRIKAEATETGRNLQEYEVDVSIVEVLPEQIDTKIKEATLEEKLEEIEHPELEKEISEVKQLSQTTEVMEEETIRFEEILPQIATTQEFLPSETRPVEMSINQKSDNNNSLLQNMINEFIPYDMPQISKAEREWQEKLERERSLLKELNEFDSVVQEEEIPVEQVIVEDHVDIEQKDNVISKDQLKEYVLEEEEEEERKPSPDVDSFEIITSDTLDINTTDSVDQTPNVTEEKPCDMDDDLTEETFEMVEVEDSGLSMGYTEDFSTKSELTEQKHDLQELDSIDQVVDILTDAPKSSDSAFEEQEEHTDTVEEPRKETSQFEEIIKTATEFVPKKGTFKLNPDAEIFVPDSTYADNLYFGPSGNAYNYGQPKFDTSARQEQFDSGFEIPSDHANNVWVTEILKDDVEKETIQGTAVTKEESIEITDKVSWSTSDEQEKIISVEKPALEDDSSGIAMEIANSVIESYEPIDTVFSELQEAIAEDSQEEPKAGKQNRIRKKKSKSPKVEPTKPSEEPKSEIDEDKNELKEANSIQNVWLTLKHDGKTYAEVVASNADRTEIPPSADSPVIETSVNLTLLTPTEKLDEITEPNVTVEIDSSDSVQQVVQMQSSAEVTEEPVSIVIEETEIIINEQPTAVQPKKDTEEELPQTETGKLKVPKKRKSRSRSRSKNNKEAPVTNVEDSELVVDMPTVEGEIPVMENVEQIEDTTAPIQIEEMDRDLTKQFETQPQVIEESVTADIQVELAYAMGDSPSHATYAEIVASRKLQQKLETLIMQKEIKQEHDLQIFPQQHEQVVQIEVLEEPHHKKEPTPEDTEGFLTVLSKKERRTRSRSRSKQKDSNLEEVLPKTDSTSAVEEPLIIKPEELQETPGKLDQPPQDATQQKSKTKKERKQKPPKADNKEITKAAEDKIDESLITEDFNIKKLRDSDDISSFLENERANITRDTLKQRPKSWADILGSKSTESSKKQELETPIETEIIRKPTVEQVGDAIVQEQPEAASTKIEVVTRQQSATEEPVHKTEGSMKPLKKKKDKKKSGDKSNGLCDIFSQVKHALTPSKNDSVIEVPEDLLPDFEEAPKREKKKRKDRKSKDKKKELEPAETTHSVLEIDKVEVTEEHIDAALDTEKPLEIIESTELKELPLTEEMFEEIPLVTEEKKVDSSFLDNERGAALGDQLVKKEAQDEKEGFFGGLISKIKSDDKKKSNKQKKKKQVSEQSEAGAEVKCENVSSEGEQLKEYKIATQEYQTSESETEKKSGTKKTSARGRRTSESEHSETEEKRKSGILGAIVTKVSDTLTGRNKKKKKGKGKEPVPVDPSQEDTIQVKEVTQEVGEHEKEEDVPIETITVEKSLEGNEEIPVQVVDTITMMQEITSKEGQNNIVSSVIMEGPDKIDNIAQELEEAMLESVVETGPMETEKQKINELVSEPIEIQEIPTETFVEEKIKDTTIEPAQNDFIIIEKSEINDNDSITDMNKPIDDKEDHNNDTLLLNLSNDGPFWFSKGQYEEAEELWRIYIGKSRVPGAEVLIPRKDDTQDKDGDGDSGHSSGQDSPTRKQFDGSFNTSYASADLPGGMCRWRDQSTYLATEVPEDIEDSADSKIDILNDSDQMVGINKELEEDLLITQKLVDDDVKKEMPTKERNEATESRGQSESIVETIAEQGTDILTINKEEMIETLTKLEQDTAGIKDNKPKQYVQAESLDEEQKTDGLSQVVEEITEVTEEIPEDKFRLTNVNNINEISQEINMNATIRKCKEGELIGRIIKLEEDIPTTNIIEVKLKDAEFRDNQSKVIPSNEDMKNIFEEVRDKSKSMVAEKTEEPIEKNDTDKETVTIYANTTIEKIIKPDIIEDNLTQVVETTENIQDVMITEDIPKNNAETMDVEEVKESIKESNVNKEVVTITEEELIGKIIGGATVKVDGADTKESIKEMCATKEVVVINEEKPTEKIITSEYIIKDIESKHDVKTESHDEEEKTDERTDVVIDSISGGSSEQTVIVISDFELKSVDDQKSDVIGNVSDIRVADLTKDYKDTDVQPGTLPDPLGPFMQHTPGGVLVDIISDDRISNNSNDSLKKVTYGYVYWNIACT